jgi:nitrogen fixation/metabolism regulation signal transduction histidine kinase
MIGIESGLGFLRRSMRFLTNFLGRGLFSIYVAVMCLCMIRKNTDDFEMVVIYIIFSLLMVVGLLSIMGSLFCCRTHKKDSLLEDSQGA